MSRVDVYQGDSREILRVLADDSVDAVVTDPPYALVSIGQRYGSAEAAPTRHEVYARATAGFMGRTWDVGETAFAIEFWAEVRRVLKPGGHVVAFSATRTYHRLAVAIEDAGFEIRDMVSWLYGSGFPKSKDLASAIDGIAAEEARRGRALMFTAWMRSTGLGAAQIDFLTGTEMGSHYLRVNSQPAIATAPHFELLRPYLPPVPEWVEDLVAERTVESENIKARAVRSIDKGSRLAVAPGQGEDRSARDIQRTAPHTAEAQAWEGWGTALKPAFEPVVLARKPLIGTLARNVLTHGVGGLNIDGCRVEGESTRRENRAEMGYYGGNLAESYSTGSDQGRWPANVVHDGSDEVLAAFPASPGQKGDVTGAEPSSAHLNVYNSRQRVGSEARRDSGSAARFFYSAKADTEDRLGSEHPTVKPVDVMAWLVRLVCPPGGVVLDPFAGTGTTGLAAMREGCDAILIEREADHANDIRRRIAWARGEGGLTAQEMLRAKLAKDPAKARGADLPLFGEVGDE